MRQRHADQPDEECQEDDRPTGEFRVRASSSGRESLLCSWSSPFGDIGRIYSRRIVPIQRGTLLR